MRKFLISAALASAALSAVPALAQDYGNRGNDQRGDRYEQRGDRYDRGDRENRGDWNRGGVDRRAVGNLLAQLNEVDLRIQRSVQRGVISPREAFGLRRESNQVRQRLAFASRGGINGREFASLQVQVNRLQQRLQFERRDRNDRRF